MRVEGKQGEWVIAKDWAPARYFCVAGDDNPRWSKRRELAMVFDTRVVADHYLYVFRKKAKEVREIGLKRKPKSLSDYVWSTTDKKLLVEMFALGCKSEAMAVQFGRTAAACRSMYNLMIQRGTL